MDMVVGIGLFSGGLDSILAVKVLQEQGIGIIGVTFTTPFFGVGRASEAARELSMDHRILDITTEHLEMVRHPKNGYGRNMNPCIDCHAMMFRKAGELMEREGADFLFSGEVLGERPMSQNRGSLVRVARESGYEPVILRPLSARLLPETLPEREGKVDGERLLDLRGRGRKRQMELAAFYGIQDYPAPAGGCLLTDPIFSRRLRDLFQHSDSVTVQDLELLKVGRHLRLDDGFKMVVGRNQSENKRLGELCAPDDLLLDVKEHPSPLALIQGGAPEPLILLATAIVLRYSDAPQDRTVTVTATESGQVREIPQMACGPEQTRDLMV
jgi:tRNA U34 2-thiouridine synthase MnmA/TrmU